MTDDCVLASTGAGEGTWWIVALALALGAAGVILLILARRTRFVVAATVVVAALALMTLGSPEAPASAASDCAATTPSPAVTPPASAPSAPVVPSVITVDGVTVNEDSGVADVVITRIGAAAGDIVLNVVTQDGTAKVSDGDYGAVNTDVTIPASATPTEAVTVPIVIDADAVYEPDEQFGVTLTTVSGAIDPASDLAATVTIVNDDPPPVLTVHSVSVNEDVGVAMVTVTRAGATAQNISFQLTTHDGTAIAGAGVGGSDYVGVNNTYTFVASANGTETITVPIPINPDTIFEPDEQFGVTATPLAGTGTIDAASVLAATVTIVNDDAPPVLTVGNTAVNEDTGVATVVITRIGAATENLEFTLSTMDGTAQNGGTGPGSDDYDPITNAQYTIPASNNASETLTVNITINPDAFVEPNETFTVNLTPISGTIAGSSDLSAIVTIVNDDS